jgi:predicted dehydrogenase
MAQTKQDAVGGVVLDLGYHVFDLINTLLPGDPILDAIIGYKDPRMRSEELEDFADIRLTYPHGPTAHVVLSRSFHSDEFSLTVDAAGGSATLIRQGIRGRIKHAHFESSNRTDSKTAEEQMMRWFLGHLDSAPARREELDIHTRNVSLLDGTYVAAASR